MNKKQPIFNHFNMNLTGERSAIIHQDIRDNFDNELKIKTGRSTKVKKIQGQFFKYIIGEHPARKNSLYLFTCFK